MALRRVVILATAGFRRSLPVSTQPLQLRFYSSADKDSDFVVLHPSGKPHITNTPAAVTDDLDDFDDDDDAEDMVAIGPSGAEYGGPTRGGKLKEPTRFGDWERKGRCSDF